MVGKDTQFGEFLAREIARTKDAYFPVKAGALSRFLTKKSKLQDLHPNPEDEFSMPEVGPNYEIISEYQKQFLHNIKVSAQYFSGEPIIVEKLYPEGYRIINGHHRWAAALRIGQATIPIQIVNLTHEADVEKILSKSKHSKRVAIDLDEAIFRPKDAPYLERSIPFAWSKLYQQRIRLGVPALFHFLAKHGYDIWLYSARYDSADSVQRFFRKYHVKVDGVITAIGKRSKNAGDDGHTLEQMITAKYLYTLHIDNGSVTQIFAGKKEFRDFALDSAEADWSQNVMNVIGTLETEGADGERKV